MNTILTGDCMDKLQELDDNSIHACVTDPPYGLAFMGRSWDDFEPKEYQEFCEDWAKECKRVLKPGGHLLAFSGNRTHHRLFTGVEDAGFEIRDTLTWHYGSGFPKASDISKTIDKREGAEREVVEEREKLQSFDSDMNRTYGGAPDREGVQEITEPATDAAKKWDGFKTGLKPATEYIVMARKPFSGATVDCVLEHGTGALNVDGTRIGCDVDTSRPAGDMGETQDKYGHYEGKQTNGSDTGGRYPSNVIFDEIEAERLDQEVGELADSTQKTSKRGYESNVYGDKSDADAGGADGYAGSGGPSRYFYTSKASKAERTENGKIENSHPTVKPQDLMEWLVKLVTKENQLVIDPFCGSGTTLKACKSLNRDFIGIEKQSKWADVARVRVGLTPNDPSVVRSNDNQSGLEVFD